MPYSLTLRNARRFDDDVEKLLSRIAEEVRTTQTITIFRDITVDEFSKMQSKVLDKINQYASLTMFRSTLRQQIRQANQTTIDNLTLQLAMEENILRFLGGLLVKKAERDPFAYRRQAKAERMAVAEELTVGELNKQFVAMRSAVANGAVTTTLELNLMTAAMVRGVDDLISASRKRINFCKDQLQKLNNETTITVKPDDNVEKIFAEYRVMVG